MAVKSFWAILNKYKFLIWGLCTLALGLLIFFRLWGSDLSKNAGIAIIIIGIVAIIYSLYKKKFK